MFWGANDSVDPTKNGLQHVPIEGGFDVTLTLFARVHVFRFAKSFGFADPLINAFFNGFAEFGENLRITYRAALAASRYVVAITPPPVDSARWPDRSVAQVQWY